MKEENITYIDLYNDMLNILNDNDYGSSWNVIKLELLKNKYETKYLILNDYITNLVKPDEYIDDYYYNSIISFCKSMDRNEKLKDLGL